MLSQSGKEFTERDFFKQPFTRAELHDLLGGQSPKAAFNFGSKAFKALEKPPESFSDDQLLQMLTEEPRYFKRPLLVIGGKLVTGANAKQVQALLN